MWLVHNVKTYGKIGNKAVFVCVIQCMSTNSEKMLYKKKTNNKIVQHLLSHLKNKYLGCALKILLQGWLITNTDTSLHPWAWALFCQDYLQYILQKTVKLVDWFQRYKSSSMVTNFAVLHISCIYLKSIGPILPIIDIFHSIASLLKCKIRLSQNVTEHFYDTLRCFSWVI